MSSPARGPTRWTPGPVFVAAATLQAVVTLLGGIGGLLVSAAFCDGSGSCGVRGLRWALWIGCCCALVAASLVVLGLVLIRLAPSTARRALVGTEAAVAVVAIATAALALRSIDSSFVALLALAESLGIVAVVAAITRDGAAQGDQSTPL
jgi:hypothetical protein